MIKPESEWNCEERKIASKNFTALHAIQCGMDDKTFRLITSLESAKEAWDILEEIFEGSRCRDLNKEGDGKTLKRVQS